MLMRVHLKCEQPIWSALGVSAHAQRVAHLSGSVTVSHPLVWSLLIWFVMYVQCVAGHAAKPQLCNDGKLSSQRSIFVLFKAMVAQIPWTYLPVQHGFSRFKHRSMTPEECEFTLVGQLP